MAKNRLENAFRSEPQPPPEEGGGERPAVAALSALSSCLPGNYFASEQEKARWKIIHRYDREGRVAEVWNDPFFQAMDMENMQKNFVISKPPLFADHMTSRMLEDHYRELIQRIVDDPSSMDGLLPESTVGEVFSFIVEGMRTNKGQPLCDDKEGLLIFALLLFRCLERMYGEKEAYLFYRVQLSGYYRELEMEGSVKLDIEHARLIQDIPLMRKVWKFVQDQFDPSEMTCDHRLAMDNMLQALKILPTQRSKFKMLEQGREASVEQAFSLTVQAASIFAGHRTWRGWLNQEGA